MASNIICIVLFALITYSNGYPAPQLDLGNTLGGLGLGSLAGGGFNVGPLRKDFNLGFGGAPAGGGIPFGGIGAANPLGRGLGGGNPLGGLGGLGGLAGGNPLGGLGRALPFGGGGGSPFGGFGGGRSPFGGGGGSPFGGFGGGSPFGGFGGGSPFG